MGEVTDVLYNDQLDYVAECLGFALCDFCKHFHHDRTCTAFPDWIPTEIMGGEHDHRKPFPGDNGIRFEKAETLRPSLRRRGDEANKPGWPDEITIKVGGVSVKVGNL